VIKLPRDYNKEYTTQMADRAQIVVRIPKEDRQKLDELTARKTITKWVRDHIKNDYRKMVKK